PMVAAYKVTWLEEIVMRLVSPLTSVILPNLILEENVVPEFLQRDCTGQNLGEALVPLMAESPQRRRQLDAFTRLDAAMRFDAIKGPDGRQEPDGGSESPSRRAADIVLGLAKPAAIERASSELAGGTIAAARSACSRAAWRRYRAGADGRSSGPDLRSFPSTARSSPPCARPRTVP